MQEKLTIHTHALRETRSYFSCPPATTVCFILIKKRRWTLITRSFVLVCDARISQNKSNDYLEAKENKKKVCLRVFVPPLLVCLCMWRTAKVQKNNSCIFLRLSVNMRILA